MTELFLGLQSVPTGACEWFAGTATARRRFSSRQTGLSIITLNAVDLPENGHQDFYDLSTVTAVSDNGRVVVGALSASIRGDGDPPDVGFVWSADTGLTLINDIIIDQPNPDYSSTDQVSSDGNRVMVTGNARSRPGSDDHDTLELIVDLSWSNATPTPTPTPTPSPTPTPTATPCPAPWQIVATMPVDVFG